MRHVAPYLALVLLVAPLAGCLGGPTSTSSPPPENDSPDVVEDPDNYTYVDNASIAEGGHIHDYWDGRETVTVLDRTDQIGGVFPSMWLTSDLQHRFRPPAGKLVPQGTERVEVTLDWNDSATNHHGPVELRVRTAADDRLRPIQEIEPGETVTIETNHSTNDLPHNRLSAWVFEFRVQNPNEPVPYEPLSFGGDVSIHVEAHRGLDLPVFPAHPDLWGDASTLPLMNRSEQVLFFEDPIGPCWQGCPIQGHAPLNGSVVPFDAAKVRVVLETDGPQGPFPRIGRVGLAYHGADTRNYTRLDADETTTSEKIYEIPVTPETADSPYAEQSQWRVLPYIEQPREDFAVWNNYTIRATVHGDTA